MSGQPRAITAKGGTSLGVSREYLGGGGAICEPARRMGQRKVTHSPRWLKNRAKPKQVSLLTGRSEHGSMSAQMN